MVVNWPNHFCHFFSRKQKLGTASESVGYDPLTSWTLSVYHFTGRLDFTINSSHMGTAVSRFTLQGIGEIQSPPWMRKESKTRSSRYVCCWPICEGMSVRITPCTRTRLRRWQWQTWTHHNLLIQTFGVIIFELVGQIDPIDLKDADGLRTFSWLLRGVMNIGSTAPTRDSWISVPPVSKH